jgi:hypothetical protein
MFAESVIRKTGQWWKLVVGVVALLAGSIVPVFESVGMSWTVGTVIAVVGYGFTLAFIKCPSCDLRWFWKALLYSEMYSPLFTKSSCPSCEHNFGGGTSSE